MKSGELHKANLLNDSSASGIIKSLQSQSVLLHGISSSVKYHDNHSTSQKMKYLYYKLGQSRVQLKLIQCIQDQVAAQKQVC